MTKIKVIEKYDAKEFEEAVNECSKSNPSFATQTHVFYDPKEDCVKFIAVLFLTKKVTK